MDAFKWRAVIAPWRSYLESVAAFWRVGNRHFGRGRAVEHRHFTGHSWVSCQGGFQKDRMNSLLAREKWS